jgi:TonB family protein
VKKQHSAFSGQHSAKTLCILSFWALISWLVAPLSVFAFDGNNLEHELRAKYQGQVVMLRNFYCGRELEFDAQSNLVGGGQPGAWTVCRDVKVEELKVHGDKLRIFGQRVYLRYDESQKQFRDVTLDESEKDKGTERYKNLLKSQKVMIEMQLPSAADSAAMQTLLDKVFYTSEQEFLDSPPQLWHKFFHVLEKREESGTQSSSPEPIEKFGAKDQKPPHAEYTPDPDFSDEARLAKYKGTAVFDTVIDANGNIARIAVKRPLGMGLDEKAEAKISLWKFRPAEKDGRAVPVEVNVEVSFNLY